MGEYIGIRKYDENDECVSYMFEKIVVENKYYHPGERYAYKIDSRYAYGFCTINKKTGEFILDKEGTDPYFLEKDKSAMFNVQIILEQIYKSGEPFPEKTCYAS